MAHCLSAHPGLSITIILTAALIQVSCGGTWHTRWANRVDTYVAQRGPNGPLKTYASGSNITMTQMAEGEYLSVRLEKVCFAKLPGALGNVKNAWVGITILSKMISDQSLFTQLEQALASNVSLESSDLLRDAYVMPTQKLNTNEGNCISGDFGTAWMPIEGWDAEKPAKFLVLIDLLDSKAYADRLAQANAFQEQANRVATAVAGKGLNEYSEKFSAVVAETTKLLKIMLPDRHILWVEHSIPIIKNPVQGLFGPAEDQYFVALFTEPKISTIEGQADKLQACNITQDAVNATISEGGVQLRPDQTVVPAPLCPPSYDYQGPYLVWRIRRASFGDIGQTYWRSITEVLTALEIGRREFEYTQTMSRASGEVEEVWMRQSTGVRLLSGRQYNLFKRFEQGLSDLLFALGLVQNATKDCPRAIQEIRELVDLNVDTSLGSSLEVTAILKRLQTRLDLNVANRRGQEPWPSA